MGVQPLSLAPALLACLRDQPLIGVRIGCAFSRKQQYLRPRANADGAGDISILGILTQAGNETRGYGPGFP